MSKNNYCETEYQQMQWWQKIQLPNIYQKVGIGLFVISFLSLLSTKFMLGEADFIKEVCRKGLLIGLLIISISKDKIEDELTIKLRAQSYAVAVVITVLYAMTQPFVEWLVASVLKGETIDYKGLGDFQVLIFMLLIQIGFFGLLKRMR